MLIKRITNTQMYIHIRMILIILMLDGDLSDASQCMVSTLDNVASGASVYPSLMDLFNDVISQTPH